MSETPQVTPSTDAPPVVPAGPPDDNKGFPPRTPESEMTDAQRLAYWQEQARKWETRRQNDVSEAYEGLTPKQVKDLQAKLESLETAQLSADEKALKAARDDAAKAATEAAKAEFLPQIQKLQVQGIAASVIQGDKLNAFMSVVNPSALVDDNGQVDETKVMGYLTAMYGDSPSPNAGPRWQNFGQFTPPPPAQKPGSGGAAEAAKRFGTKTS